MRISCLLVLSNLFFSCGAYAFETHASISTGAGYDYLQKNTYVKGGFVLSAPIGLGFAWWSYTGVGSNAEDVMWAAHSQGIDWAYNRLTTGLVYTISKDPDKLTTTKVPFQHVVGMNVKIKLW